MLWKLHKYHSILESILLFFFIMLRKPISTKTIAASSLVKPKNVPKWGKHVLTQLCILIDLCVSRKFLLFDFGTQSLYLFYSGIYFRKSERILWLKQCIGIIVMGLRPFHMALIKDQSTICETGVTPFMINETVIQWPVKDMGVVEKFIIKY